MVDAISNENQIRAMLEGWAEAVRDGDLDRICAHHTEDILMFDVPMPLQSKGMEAYKKTWDLFFKFSKGGPGSFDLTDLQITMSDTVAFAHALIDVSGNLARLTVGLRKVNGEWMITHEHHSYPFPEESAE